ncbi:hypothetical protein ACFLVB_04730 [Chloroflexota bacterium]
MPEIPIKVILGVLFLILAISILVITKIVIKPKRNLCEESTEQILSNHINRLTQLEKAMDELFSKNQVINSIDDAFQKIPLYVSCIDSKEDEYCRNYLRKKYRSGYKRYDEERL